MTTVPYGQMIPEVKKNVHKTSLSLDDYWFNGSFRRKIRGIKDFNKKFYIPNNAVLVVAGDFNAAQTKEWIQKYFGG
jgi:endonuclease/exonuclease/phosphatase family metal-dependent hydrolase